MTSFEESGDASLYREEISLYQQIFAAYKDGDLETLQSIAIQLTGNGLPDELPEPEKTQLQMTMGYIGALHLSNPTGLRD